jgi:hypothetical protein
VAPDAAGLTDAATAHASDGACVPSDAAITAAAVGAPCVPDEEKSPQFEGSSAETISLGNNNPGCASRSCVINHFQGRVTCPYGQSASGQGPDGTPGCKAAGACDPVTVEVSEQLTCRTAAEAVYCSCRCANVDGKTDDGATYCTCPDTMTCALTFPELLGPDGGFTTGATYCVKAGTEFDGGLCSTTCDPTKAPCP